jgi:2-polyprenyl-6-hydroxyphenyl methylase/3-demethylubiquinone-9 3-methyltransferase
MPDSNSLKDVSQHFAFGRNWASYATMIDESRIRSAEEGLTRLLGKAELEGRTFLDIGCGSGIHSLAAIRLGVRRVLATDIDSDSVATTRATLEAHAPPGSWECRAISVFDLDPADVGTFDVVYSWGVLHHTGAMYEAVARAMRLVAPDGVLCIALYGKTRYCGFWKIEKRLYSRSPAAVQRLVRRAYGFAQRLSVRRHGRDFDQVVATYKQRRGMDWEHDVHDWLGGYPYESISRDEAHAMFERSGFSLVREFVQPYGMLGSGCDEYVARRRSPAR